MLMMVIISIICLWKTIEEISAKGALSSKGMKSYNQKNMINIKVLPQGSVSSDIEADSGAELIEVHLTEVI